MDIDHVGAVVQKNNYGGHKMRHIFIEGITSWKILCKHKMLFFLLVIQCIFSVWFLGNVSQYVKDSKDGTETLQEDILGKQYYRLHECLDDTMYSIYMSEESNSLYDDLFQTLTEIRNSDNYAYLFVTCQPISIYGENIKNEMLYGFEEGTSNEVIDDIYAVKSLQVSQNVFQEFNMKFAEGACWNEDEISYSDVEIPIVVGYEYREIFEIGDVIQGTYLFKDGNYRVVGILPEDATISDGESFYNCNRYIILPSIQETTIENNPTDTDKARLLQQLTGVVVSDIGYASIVEEITDIVKRNNLIYSQDIILTDVSNNGENILDTYSAMTDELLMQFVIILILFVVYTVLSMTLTINGLMQDYQYEFSVFLLSGAKISDVAFIAHCTIFIVIGIGDLFAISILLLQNTDMIVLGFVFLVSVLMHIISCIYPISKLRKIDIYTVIGGKE